MLQVILPWLITDVYSQSSQTAEAEYYDTESGLEIVFPEGWRVTEARTVNQTSVVAVPENASLQRASLAANIVKRGSAQDISVDSGIDLLNSFGARCIEPDFNYDTMNNMQVLKFILDCKSEDGLSPKKYMMTLLQTEAYTIGVTYYASPEIYDKYLTEVNSSLQTFRVPNTIDAPAIPEFPHTLIVTISGVFVITILLGRLILQKRKA